LPNREVGIPDWDEVEGAVSGRLSAVAARGRPKYGERPNKGQA